MALKASFVCPYAHTSATMENLPAAQNLLGLFRTQSNKMIVWCSATLLPLGQFLCVHCAV